MLVHHYLEYFARNYPESPCFTQDEQKLNYSEVNCLSNQLANGLLDLGIEKGQRVAVLGENSIEHALMFYAAGKIGAVAVPLNYRLAPAELAYIIDDSEVALLLATDPTDATLAPLMELIKDDVQVFTNNLDNTRHLHEWMAQYESTAPAIEVNTEDAFLQLYTSGTTGNPKGVVLCHGNIIALNTMTVTSMTVRADTGSATVTCAPLFHIGGAGSIFLAICSGQHTLLHKNFDPMLVVEQMETYPVTSIFLVPAMIMAILQIPGIEQRDFSNVEQITYGSAPISETVLRRAMEVFQMSLHPTIRDDGNCWHRR